MQENKAFEDIEIYCIAKTLQSAIFSDKFDGTSGIFYGCQYCKYREECMPNGVPHENMIHDKVRKKLQNLTDVDLDLFVIPNKFIDIHQR